MITHTVAFRLKDNSKLADFLFRARKLSTIRGVENFEVLRQVGKKSHYTHALSMAFSDQHSYDHYNEHADHQAFVKTVWIPLVEDFMELDYIAEG